MSAAVPAAIDTVLDLLDRLPEPLTDRGRP